MGTPCAGPAVHLPSQRVTIVLDSGGVSAISGRPRRVAWLRTLGAWPPVVPAPVLTECLTGDHRRDFHTNQLLSICRVQAIDEVLARAGARLRTDARRRGVSATDALVIAVAEHTSEAVVLTGDQADIEALVAVAQRPITVHPV